MARAALKCPSCRFHVKETTIRGSFRCPSCGADLRIPYSYTLKIELLSILFAPTALMAVGVKLYSFTFVFAILPTLLAMYFIVGFLTFKLAPPALELVDNGFEESNQNHSP
jgi:hypothetical protein